MNYAGKFGSGLDSHSEALVDIDSLSHRSDGDTVTLPNAHLLFSGDYERSGADLIVSDHDHRVVVPNYFHGDKRPTLVSPDGAPLDPKVIEALTGHVQYAQAGGSSAAAAAKVVGHVIKMTGSASIVRNGVTIDLNNGDNVLQNDVVQTGSGSTLGLVMIDGTTFNLTAGARLMLNDLTYDASSTSNTSLFTLVQGAASFVAGQVAKTGDMKVGTPVATMGIRGTAVILDISSVDGKVSISVVDQRDGQIHAVQVFNASGILIGTVSSNGSGLTLTPTANFEVIAQESNKSVTQVTQEFNAFQTLLQTYDAGKVLFPNLPQHTDNGGGNSNPQSTTRYASSSPPTSVATEYHSPVGNVPASPPASGNAPTVVQLSVSPGAAPAGSPPPPSADPVVVQVQVVIPTTPLPFVVTPPALSRVSGDGGDHFGPVMSADGQYVVYDPDGAIFLYDRATNTTITVAAPGGGFTYSGQTISADGHHIVFQGSDGTNSYVFIYNNDPSDPAHYHHKIQLVAGGAPAISGDGSTIVVEQGGSSIGIYDSQGHAIAAAITPAAIGMSGTVWRPAISADGHMIAFWSTDAAAPGGFGHLFTYNLSTGIAAEIAITATDAGTSAASFSADGRYVVYQSDAPGGHSEIYLYDLSTGQVVFHTANAAGASYNPVISPDGHYIIFASDAQLVPGGDTNSVTDTYVVDVTDPGHPVYTLVSNLGNGTQPDAASNLGAAISAGGLFIAFGSAASNLSAGDTPGTGDIFVVDSSSGRSAIIVEGANAPAILTAGGVIALTGDHTGITIAVSDTFGRFTATFNAQGNIEWHFTEPRSDFASLLPGQISIQNFVITLNNSIGTTTIPVRVSVYDADQPAVSVVSNPGTIAGDNGNNILLGTTGNDILQGFGGDDSITGLTGVDRAVYLDATGGITADLATGIVSGQSVGTDTLSGIEAIQGSNFADHYSAAGFTGISGVRGLATGFNSFEGMAGDDIITGNGRTQISYSHALAGVTVDFLGAPSHGTAQDSADLLHHTAIDLAGTGIDNFTGVYSVRGSQFSDTLLGSNNATRTDVFYGGGGNDTIDGRGGYDLVVYSNFAGDSATSGVSINLATGIVVGNASVGTDTLRGIELVRGTSFADSFTAADFSGASANMGSFGTFNEFEGMGGNDVVIGNGNTRVSYANASAAVTVDLANGTAQDRADATNHTTLDLAGVGVDAILGGVNAARGSDFDDRLFGSNTLGLAVESFIGGKGDDFINGRGGYDRVLYSTASDDPVTGGITVEMALGKVTGDASVGIDTLRSVEMVRATNFSDSYDATGFSGSSTNAASNGNFNEFEGMDGDDSVTGNGNTQIAFYTAGAGVLVDLADTSGGGTGTSQDLADALNDTTLDLASVGIDTLHGGVNSVVGSQFGDVFYGSDNSAGLNERFEGRAGDDFIDGRAGFDQAIYYIDTAVGAGITVQMAAGTVDGDAAVGHDTLRSIESVTGTRFADTYDASGFGDSGHLDPATSNVGNFGSFNEFQGYGGDDSITGNGNTQIVYYNANAGVIVDLADTGTGGTGTAKSTVADNAGIGHDILHGGVKAVQGSAFNDRLYGDANANVIGGQGGDDRLDGRGGDDLLRGGTGADTFVYAAGYGADTIADFNRGEGDKIDLSGVPGVYSLDDVLLLASSTNDGADTLIYLSEGNSLTLSGVSLASLAAGDFIYAPPPPAPAAITGDHNGSVSEDGIITDASGNVVSFDADAVHDGGTLTVHDPDAGENHFQAVAASALQGDYGLFTFNENTGAWTYTLDHGLANSLAVGQTKHDTLTVTSFDGTATEVIDVAVHGSNDAPVAVAVVQTGVEDGGTVTGSLTSNVSDPDQGDHVNFAQSGSVAGLTINSNGFYSFNPGDAAYQHLAAGTTTDVVAHYTVTDSHGAQTTADLTFTVTGVNDAPTTDANSASGVEDTPLLLSLTGQDIDGTVSYFRITGLPQYGALFLDQAGTQPIDPDHIPATANQASLWFLPDTDFNGSTSFQYAAVDDKGAADAAPATYSVSFDPVNDAPQFLVGPGDADTATITDSAAFDTIQGVSGNVSYTDPDSSGFGFSAALGSSSHGSFLGSFGGGPGNGSTAHWVYSITGANLDSLAQGETVTETGQVLLYENGSPVGSHALTVTLIGADDAPTVEAQSVSTAEDTLLAITLTGADVDHGDAVDTFRITSLPNGTLYSDAAGTHQIGFNDPIAAVNNQVTVYFQPAANASDSTSFEYKANDGSLDSTAATVSISVTPVNDPPVAHDASIILNEDDSISGQVTFSDLEGGAMSLSLMSDVSHGTLVFRADGSFDYTPTHDFFGQDSFTYKVIDGSVESNVATVIFNVANVLDGPLGIAGDLSVIGVKGSSILLTSADFRTINSLSAADQQTFTVEHISHGHLFNSALGEDIAVDGTFTQADLDAGQIRFVAGDSVYVGQASFAVSMSDGVTPPVATTVGVTLVDADIRVLTASGYDFAADDPITAMGLGYVDSYVAEFFTVTDASSNRQITFTGSDFVFDRPNHHFTAGTITGITIAAIIAGNPGDPPTCENLASLGVNVSAAAWYDAVYAKAHGDSGPMEALTASWSFNFVGTGGADGFTSADVNDYFTGGAGNDTLGGEFGYDRASYGGLAGPINVQLADGTVAEYSTGLVLTGADTLRSIELVTGSNYDDTFNAGPTFSNPLGFNASSTNAGSTVTSNVAGMFNEFEGRGGHDDITGNGQTRISYLHATAGVVVTFNPDSWNPAVFAAPGAAGVAVGDASVGQDSFVGVNGVRGSNFNDFFFGSNNPTGTAENFEGMGGDDSIDGGGGFDRAIYQLTSDGVGIDVQLALGTVSDRSGGWDVGHDTLRSVEAVWGTNFADIYNAAGFTASNATTPSANSGNAGLNGAPSDFNEFEGGGGDDQITGNGNTRVAFYQATGGVTVTLTSGGAGDAFGNASVGHDTFASGVSRVRGSEFNDSITGNGGNNVFGGQGGNDLIDGRGGNDTLTGGTGSDIFIYNANAGNGNATLSNNDIILDFNRAEGDVIDLSANTSFHGLADVLAHTNFSSGNAVISFAASSGQPATLTVNGMTSFAPGDFLFAGQVGVMVVTPDGYDFSTIYADLAASHAVVESNTGTGRFFLVDSAHGLTFEMLGSGFSYNATSHLPTAGTIGAIHIFETADPALISNDNLLVYSADWSLSANTLFTNLGNYNDSQQHAAGLAALDTQFGGQTYHYVGASGVVTTDVLVHSGADLFIGGNHADIFNGLAGDDTVDYSHASSGITADLGTPANNSGVAALGDTYTSIENLRGSNFADTLTGDGSNNVLEGGAGDDLLNGAGGNNTASYEHATAGVTVSLATGAQQNTIGAGSDTLTNFSNLNGSQFNDVLTGNSADNILFGNGGNDTFVFNQTSGGIGHDTIGDFIAGHDHIALDYAAFDAIGPNDFSAWVAAGHVTVSGSDVLIDLNLDAQNTILLRNVSIANLHANDFILPAGGGFA